MTPTTKVVQGMATRADPRRRTCAHDRARRREPLRGVATAGPLLLWMSGCAAPDPLPPLPEPPDGSELVMQLGDLEVYRAFDGELCAGTMRRLELHVQGLSEVFGVEPPRARLFLHRDAEAIDEACHFPVEAHGCASWWGAHAMPHTATHELAHVFVNSITDNVDTRPALEEGVARYLSGGGPPGAWGYGGVPWTSPGNLLSLEGLRSLLAVRSPFDLYASDHRAARHFSAWVIDHFGVEAFLSAYVATGTTSADEDVERSLAEALGFASLADLHAEYEATRALGYPPVPNTTRVFSAEELARGVALDTSCAGEYTEGPIGTELMTVVWLEVAEAGEHAVTYEPLPLGHNPPRLQLTELLYEELPPGAWRAESCGYDWSPEPLHIAFPVAGHYEISGRDCQPGGSPCRGLHAADEAAQVVLSLEHLGNGECEPF